jgi:hypothetical protein
MYRLRVWIAVTLAWLLLFFNIERFHEPINIASFVYVLAAAIAIVIVAARPWQSVSLATSLVISLGLLLILKLWWNYGILGPHLPLTVTEAVAITLTVLLARGIGQCIQEFEEGATHVMTMHLGKGQLRFESGQADLYREMRRARDFERPVAMLAVSAEGESTSAAMNRFIEEVQRNAIRRYLDARVGELLIRELKDCDIVTHCDDHFVVMLPEANLEQAADVVTRLRRRASEELGLQLEFGTATFPEQEVTLSGLLQRAEKEMRSPQGVQQQPAVALG